MPLHRVKAAQIQIPAVARAFSSHEFQMFRISQARTVPICTQVETLPQILGGNRLMGVVSSIAPAPRRM
jgi:hypothetical protein